MSLHIKFTQQIIEGHRILVYSSSLKFKHASNFNPLRLIDE